MAFRQSLWMKKLGPMRRSSSLIRKRKRRRARSSSSSAAGRGDRLSSLGRGVLGRVLSFLPSSKEAARMALLSTRWRGAFAGVDAVSLSEPKSHAVMPWNYVPPDRAAPPLAAAVVTAALLARHRSSPPPPLRALRVALDSYRQQYASAVDHWVSYALSHAAANGGLELCLRLGRQTLCDRSGFPYLASGSPTPAGSSEEDHLPRPIRRLRSPTGDRGRGRASSSSDDSTPGSDDDAVSADDGTFPASSRSWEYTMPRSLFSCAVLRSLTIGACRLCPPPAISLPSLETLLLAGVSDEEQEVQRLIAACPRLADLTLETCRTVTALSLLGNRRLRRLALRCCHRLATVAIAVDGGTLLRSFEYRGAVPATSLLPALRRGGHGNGGPSSFSFESCKVDICGSEVSSREEIARLGRFLRLLAASAKHLHLRSLRLGSGLCHRRATMETTALPTFSNLLHLELTGCLPHADAAVSGILRHAPRLEVLTLVFEATRSRCWEDAHELRYNEHEVLAAGAAPAAVPPCLRDRVREINLVHYHGGTAQRTLAKFLLCNALVLDRLYCGFARGPLWIQTKLRDEIQGWAMNKPENRIFS